MADGAALNLLNMRGMTLQQIKQLEATRQRLVDGVTAGCVATLIMTAFVLAAPALGGSRLPVRAAQALLSLRGHPLVAVGALALHLGYGSLAGGLFAVGARRITPARGLLFGFALWGIAVTIYSPLVGLGFVTSREPALAVLTLPVHLLYGAALGALAPRGEITQTLATEG
jgi:hypothetical protein